MVEAFPIDLDNLEQIEFDEPVPDAGVEQEPEEQTEPEVKQPPSELGAPR